VNAAGLIFNF